MPIKEKTGGTWVKCNGNREIEKMGQDIMNILRYT